MRASLLRQRLVALFALALLLFNYPLIALWDHEAAVWGLPLFPTALFAIWGLLIAAVAWLMERREPEPPETVEPPRPAPDERPRA